VRRALALLLGLLPGLLTGAALAEGYDRAVPIRFAAGTGSGLVEGVVIRGERDCYSVTRRVGQVMRVTVRALRDNAAFQLYTPG